MRKSNKMALLAEYQKLGTISELRELKNTKTAYHLMAGELIHIIKAGDEPEIKKFVCEIDYADLGEQGYKHVFQAVLQKFQEHYESELAAKKSKMEEA